MRSARAASRALQSSAANREPSARGLPLLGPLPLHGDDAVDHREARAHGEVQVEQHVGEVLAALGADMELRLGQAGDAAVGQLDAAREAHELMRLEHADLDDGVGVGEGASEREAAEQPPARHHEHRAVVLDVDDGHLLLEAHVGHAAELVGARDLGRSVETAGAVGDKRDCALRLERAQHAAQGLRVGAHGGLGRCAAQEVHLDGDALAGGHDGRPAAERLDEALKAGGQTNAVDGVDVADERGAAVARGPWHVTHAGGFSATTTLWYRPTWPGAWTARSRSPRPVSVARRSSSASR